MLFDHGILALLRRRQFPRLPAEVRSTVLLSSLARHRTDSFAAFEAATLGGTRALGLDHTIGSIRKGKSADLIALHCGGIDGIPVHNVADYIVHSANWTNPIRPHHGLYEPKPGTKSP